MAEKKYLDLTGLTHYDEKVKVFIAAAIKAGATDEVAKLVALLGASEKGEAEETILARLTAIEGNIGDMQLGDLVDETKTLTKAILGEKARAEGVEGKLLALHASKDETGAKKTVAEEVSAGIATVVAEAPEAFDTLKEIAEWIGTGDVANTTAATMLSDIEGLKTQVGKASEGTQGEEGYTPATGLVARIDALEAVNAAADTYAAITNNEIDALFTTTQTGDGE